MEAIKLENYTYEDYLKISKSTEKRVELIFGKIYMMAGASAKHQDVVLNIAITLRNESECKPRVAPYDLKLKCSFDANIESTNVVQPDIMLFCEDINLPCAIFEVLSPSTASKDKTDKLSLYECAGIKEYFIVEPEYKVVERFILKDNKYQFAGNFTQSMKMPIDCIGKEVDVAYFFEGVE
ncbi:Uma2 family endonuclease [Nitrosophilus kaiyonis]|uniref:Uma2 family endonuclease n=1 Tax=Nitrosophilus kaiyonis TaxID=2930200 RepID=UPI002492FFEC|nr:Uma2 family endonuclease [Nitrosophilus kaiyonis]